MSKRGGAVLQKDAPWRAPASSSKPIPKIYHSPVLRFPQNPYSNYALSVMKHPNPIGSGLGKEAMVEAAGPDCIVPGQIVPIKLLGLKVWPININLKFMEPVGRELKQIGKVQWVGDAGSIEINGIDYPLQQAHWHSPSEHTINARRYDMELHMVHSNFKNQIAVVAVLYKIGKPDPFLSKLMRNISSMVDKKNEKRNLGLTDPNEINISGRRFYRYIGSLTVPPCTEAVIWTIKKKLRTVSRDQIKLLREAVHDYAERNARPLQPLNQRDIHLYTPEKKNN